MYVMTVMGPIDPEDLGRVLMHEHIIKDTWELHPDNNWLLQDVEIAVQEVEAFARTGGGTIVELTCIGMGRNVRALRQISQRTGVHIVASTGFSRQPLYPQMVYETPTVKLADLMVSELEHGIDGTGIRAGIIGEIATERRFIKPEEERVFRAAAMAQSRMGVAISTHTHKGELAHDQLDILEHAGANLERVVIGHLGDRRGDQEVDLHCSLAERGAYIQYDHIGKQLFQLDTVRADMIAEMVHRGYTRQILLSMDTALKTDLHTWGGVGYDYLFKEFVSLLRSQGVSESDIHTMIVENPKRVLAIDEGRQVA